MKIVKISSSKGIVHRGHQPKAAANKTSAKPQPPNQGSSVVPPIKYESGKGGIAGR